MYAARNRMILCSLVAALMAAGCDDKGPLTDATKDTEKFAGLEADRIACVDRINAFRASLNLASYVRWEAGETCADQAAKTDAERHDAHSAFGSCEEWAQNECPGWRSVSSVIDDCLQSMWDEGPGEDFNTHGHYINMTNESYTQVACGFYITPDGDVWAVQNFQ